MSAKAINNDSAGLSMGIRAVLLSNAELSDAERLVSSAWWYLESTGTDCIALLDCIELLSGVDLLGCIVVIRIVGYTKCKALMSMSITLIPTKGRISPPKPYISKLRRNRLMAESGL